MKNSKSLYLNAHFTIFVPKIIGITDNHDKTLTLLALEDDELDPKPTVADFDSLDQQLLGGLQLKIYN